MKKVLTIVLLLLIVVLSGCGMDMSEEPYNEPSTFDSYIVFGKSSLTYTSVETADILYGTGNTVDDFTLYIENTREVTVSEIEAYQVLLTKLVQIETLDHTFSFESIPNYSSQDIEDYAGKSGIELTITDIILFNTLKTDIEGMMTSSYEDLLSKKDYVEYRLDRDLTPEEYNGLEILQGDYYRLIVQGNQYSFETNTFEELMNLFETELQYTPTEEIEDLLELAYNIVNSLFVE